MEKYFSIGSYNCLDAVMMNGCSADKVVEYMNKGIGDFHPYDEENKTYVTEKGTNKAIEINAKDILSSAGYDKVVAMMMEYVGESN